MEILKFLGKLWPFAQFTRLDWAYFFYITEIQKAITQRPQKLSPLFLTYQQLIVHKIDTAKKNSGFLLFWPKFDPLKIFAPRSIRLNFLTSPNFKQQ